MTVRVSAVEARRGLGRLLNVVALAGEDAVIERTGKGIARLTGLEAPARVRSTGKLDFRKARGLGRALWRGVNVEEYLKKERDERNRLEMSILKSPNDPETRKKD